MQTFLPYDNFAASASVLDYRRLGKQRVEAKQILNVLLNPGAKKGWAHHPAVLMWKGYELLLMNYFDAMALEWEMRGYVHNMGYYTDEDRYAPGVGQGYPDWLRNNPPFHLSHKSNLVRKDKYYRGVWPDVPDNLPYIWPVTIQTLKAEQNGETDKRRAR